MNILLLRGGNYVGKVSEAEIAYQHNNNDRETTSFDCKSGIYAFWVL